MAQAFHVRKLMLVNEISFKYSKMFSMNKLMFAAFGGPLMEKRRKNSYFRENLSIKTLFLSYSSKDREFASRLACDLQAKGFDVWYDQWQLNVGDSLLEKIQEGIERASWLVIVLSPHSVKSKWVKEELNFGFVRQLAENSIFILPVLYKDCQIPPFLREKVYADFRSDYQDGLNCLLKTLKRRYLDQLQFQKNRAISYYYVPDPLLYSSGAILDFYVRDARNTFRPELLNRLPGLWRGSTGCMWLEIEGNCFTGRYDWLGFESSGRLRGEIVLNAIVFNWYWEISEERGGGFFYVLPDLLFGGWWMEYDYIDPRELLSNCKMPPHRWMFKKS